MGVWSHERKGDRVSVTIEPFGEPDPVVRSGAEAEAERLAAFLGAATAVGWRA